MELTKNDTQMAKGLAILGMVTLHLFCRSGELPYTPLIWIKGIPLIYYLALFGDICVPIYCFCSGYAQAVSLEQFQKNPHNFRLILRLLLNYWVVLILFSCIGLLFQPSGNIPGTLQTFLGNFFLINFSYNGAWWYIVTYILLLIATPAIFTLICKLHPIASLSISGIAYFIAYVFRFIAPLTFESFFLDWIWRQLLLFFTSQFSFFIGMICFRYKIISYLHLRLDHVRYNFFLYILIPLGAFLFHCAVPSMIIAPITGLLTLGCFFMMPKCNILKKWLLFLGKHSTNIWLIHMFFYLTLFQNLVFCAKYPILILIFIFTISIGVSMILHPITTAFYTIFLK